MTTSKVVFDPFSQEHFDGPWEIYRRLREEAPVYYNEEHDFYALSRHADVAAAYKDFATYSSAYGLDLATVRSHEPFCYGTKAGGWPCKTSQDGPMSRSAR